MFFSALNKKNVYISSMMCKIIFQIHIRDVTFTRKIAIKFTNAKHLIVDPLKKD